MRCFKYFLYCHSRITYCLADFTMSLPCFPYGHSSGMTERQKKAFLRCCSGARIPPPFGCVPTVYFAPSRLELTPFSLPGCVALDDGAAEKIRYFVVAQGLEYLHPDITTPRFTLYAQKRQKRFAVFVAIPANNFSHLAVLHVPAP